MPIAVTIAEIARNPLPSWLLAAPPAVAAIAINSKTIPPRIFRIAMIVTPVGRESGETIAGDVLSSVVAPVIDAGLPQLVQNLTWGSIFAPQWVQCISACILAYFFKKIY